MPVTVAAFYSTYALQRSAGTLDLSKTRCIRPDCRAGEASRALELTGLTVARPVVLLSQDTFGVWETICVTAVLALARCGLCGGRFRVLPCDVLPHKQYGLAPIEFVSEVYSKGNVGLRKAVAQLLGDRIPVHTSLHGWTEGIGAHTSGLPAGDQPGALPTDALLVETERRVAGVKEARAKVPTIPEVRYRSEPRRQRLAAAFIFLACSVVVAKNVTVPNALAEWRRQFLGWVQVDMCPMGFRSSLSSTSFEHPEKQGVASSGRGELAEPSRWKNGTRSPPGGSSNSLQH